MTDPEASPDWPTISHGVINDCPSTFYRAATIELLGLVEQIGPLGAPEIEFKKVYKFLHYNEPQRVKKVAEEILHAKLDRTSHTPLVKNNAWKYVVSAFDGWVARARVFYLAAGIVEGTLKSRLDDRLTEQFGPKWHESNEAVPSSVFDQMKKEDGLQKLGAIRRLLEEAGEPTNLEEALKLTNDIRKETAATEEVETSDSGSDFVSHLPFSQLRSFFQTKRLWSKGPNLQTLFQPMKGEHSVLKEDIDKVLKTIHEMRNEVAHYRPSGRLSFVEGLFALAKLARWLQVDLQWVYGSIDSRQSTELSHLLEAHYAATLGRAKKKSQACVGGGCSVGEPFDVLLSEAPTSAASECLTDGVVLACMYHRVQLRAIVHHAPWP